TPIIDESHLYHHEQSWVEKYHEVLISGQDTANIEVSKSLRRLTIDEAKIIQTFPKNYIFCGTQSKIFTQIGNAVPCKLAEIVGLVVKNKIADQLYRKHEKKIQDELYLEQV
ncbi:MAG: DNA cytosine methyltransferase, partial [Bacilli bacterium]